jgi:hypothetical protein
MLTIKEKILQALGTVPMSRRQISDAIGITDIFLELDQLMSEDKVYREKEQLTEMEKHEKGLPLDQPKYRWVFSRIF